MKTMVIIGTSIMLATALLTPYISLKAEDPKEIIQRMEDNMRGESPYSEMTMTTVRPRYTREISMKSWSLGEEYALILITAPARDKGTAFLKRGNEIWNYVPGIDRIVKMPPSMMSQSWMGSDFTNDHLVRGVSTVDDYSHTLLRSESLDGHECYVIELIPKPEAPVVYDKVFYWISKEYYLPVKIENFDEFNDLASTIFFKEISRIGGRDFPVVMEMVPAARSGQKTILTTTNADFSVDLTQGFFTLQNLTNIR
jgi:outer membrane lipoprotein-sorting protein